MIMTQERMILKGQVQLEKMARFVRQAAKDGRPIDQVEGVLWQSLLTLGHTLLTGNVAGICPECGQEILTATAPGSG